MKYMRSLVAVLFISFNLSAQDPALTVFNQVNNAAKLINTIVSKLI